MGEQIKKIIGNVSATVIANVIGTIVSLLTNLIAPKILGVETYGYWQLYVLYIGYVGIVELGWAEGLYLKLGGRKITDLKDSFIDVQLKVFCVFQIILSLVILGGTLFISNDTRFLFVVVCLMIFPANLKVFCNYVLLATNEIKSYAQVTILDRMLFGGGLVLCFLFNWTSIFAVVLIDCLARILSAIYSLNKIRSALFVGRNVSKEITSDIFDSILCGSKLLIANLASTLVIGIVRIVISSKWDIVVFSQISFTISITNMVLVLINAIGVALFPVLKTVHEEQLVKTYEMLRTGLTILMIVGMAFFFPAKVILSFWLPEYTMSLYYMGIIFPLIIYETRTAMLLNTYYKALRLEKELLVANIYSLIISFGLAVFSVYFLENVICAVGSILLVLMFRGIYLENHLSKHIKIETIKDNIVEVIICVMFIISTSFVGGCLGFWVYVMVIGGYILINREKMKKMLNVIKFMK